MKKQWKRILPDPNKLKRLRLLQIFGERLHSPNLWHLNRQSMTRAVSVGLFTAFMPIPVQMMMAAGLAILVNANIPFSVLLVWITNPFTMTPIFYFAYRVGAGILDMPVPSERHFKITDLSFSWFFEKLVQFWEPLLLGSLILGISAAIIGNIAFRILWRIWLTDTGGRGASVGNNASRSHRTQITSL